MSPRPRRRTIDMLERREDEAIQQEEEQRLQGVEVRPLQYTVASLIGDLRRFPDSLPVRIHVERKVPLNETIDITYICEDHPALDVLLEDGTVTIINYANK